jgi:hypothetical protein
MFNKISEIATAWITAANPTPAQTELAQKRYEICNGCEYRKVVTKKLKIGEICGECGCPLSKKIFSQEFDSCPKHYWLEVETAHFKTKKSIL